MIGRKPARGFRRTYPPLIHQARQTDEVRNRMNGAPILQYPVNSSMNRGLHVSSSLKGLMIRKSFRFRQNR